MVRLNAEQLTLLELIKASLFGTEPDFPEQVDWNRVYELAKQQTVIALTEPAVPAAYKGMWMKGACRNKAYYIRLLYEQDNLVKLFESAGIPLVILKGTAAAMYYPVPSRRTMGDVDFLVPQERFDDAQSLMEESGYTFVHESYRHREYVKNGVPFELHRRFSSGHYRDIEHIIVPGIARAERYAIQSSAFPGLPVCENGMVLLGHMMQHLTARGLGIRQIIDWMMFVHRELDDTLWETSFQALAREAGLEKLAITATALCRTWLGLPDQLTWCDGADGELAAQIMEHVFIDGNFGHEKPATEKTLYSIKKEGAFSFLQRAGLINWKAAQKHRFLRPFAWLFQLCRLCRKSVSAALRGENVLKGFKTGAEKEEIWKKLES